MRKLLTLAVILTMSTPVAMASFEQFAAPTEGNINFAPLARYEFEKKETLDFVNNAEEYKTKREQKDRYLDYQEGRFDVPPMMNTQFNIKSAPGSNNMRFVKDENGKLRIKSGY